MLCPLGKVIGIAAPTILILIVLRLKVRLLLARRLPDFLHALVRVDLLQDDAHC